MGSRWSFIRPYWTVAEGLKLNGSVFNDTFNKGCDLKLGSRLAILSSARKTYIGSVLFRASAFTGAQLASREPAVIGRFGP